MSAPDAAELELIAQFRKNVQDLNLTGDQAEDKYLIRWIRARDGDLTAAEAMLRATMKWRAENDIDNILNWDLPVELTTLCPCEFLGYDKDNSPVLLIPMGSWDLRKVFQIGEKDSFIRFADQLFEKSLHYMKGKVTREGHPVTQFVFIVDYDRLSMRTLASFGAVDMVLQCVRRFEANQPETMKTIFAVNANYVFSTLFALIKPLLSEKTFGKMEIYNTNVDKWKPILNARMPVSILPPKYGGTNTGLSDAFAAALSSIEAAPAENVEEVTEFFAVTVPAGDKLALAFTVEEGNSTIVWSFKTEKYDISFAVNRDEKAYIENKRVNSHEAIQEGTITCETPGDYIFTFDNSYSRLRTKALSYRIDVKTPGGKTQILFS